MTGQWLSSAVLGAYRKKAFIASIGLFLHLGPSYFAPSTGIVPLRTNVASDLALHWVIRPIGVDEDADLRSLVGLDIIHSYGVGVRRSIQIV